MSPEPYAAFHAHPWRDPADTLGGRSRGHRGEGQPPPVGETYRTVVEAEVQEKIGGHGSGVLLAINRFLGIGEGALAADSRPEQPAPLDVERDQTEELALTAVGRYHEALRAIQGIQATALGVIRANGFRFDFVPAKPLADLSESERWQKLAFTFYTDLCEASATAEAALDDDRRAVRPEEPPE